MVPCMARPMPAGTAGILALALSLVAFGIGMGSGYGGRLVVGLCGVWQCTVGLGAGWGWGVGVCA